jgi:hypothetical protein
MTAVVVAEGSSCEVLACVCVCVYTSFSLVSLFATVSGTTSFAQPRRQQRPKWICGLRGETALTARFPSGGAFFWFPRVVKTIRGTAGKPRPDRQAEKGAPTPLPPRKLETRKGERDQKYRPTRARKSLPDSFSKIEKNMQREGSRKARHKGPIARAPMGGACVRTEHDRWQKEEECEICGNDIVARALRSQSRGLRACT